MSQRIQTWPAHFEAPLAAALAHLGYSLAEPRRIAQAVQRMSDLYTQNALAPTPWHEPWARAAQLAYYFPLNHARARAVAQEAARLGFLDDISSITDFGSGAGAALFAFSERRPTAELIAIDTSAEALDLNRELKPPYARTIRRRNGRSTSLDSARGLLVASFAFTELETFQDDWHGFEALAIIEPSTQDDGRRLMSERQRLIDRGYRIWAPCTHELSCPLLTLSARDWCHDRIHWQAPAWFLEIEKHLPMKNRTLTFSYLLAHRHKAPPAALVRHARLTGDMLPEKGKTRQSLCRSADREFLAWFPQRMSRGESIHLERGDLVALGDCELKSNELRLKTPTDIKTLNPDESPGLEA